MPSPIPFNPADQTRADYERNSVDHVHSDVQDRAIHLRVNQELFKAGDRIRGKRHFFFYALYLIRRSGWFRRVAERRTWVNERWPDGAAQSDTLRDLKQALTLEILEKERLGLSHPTYDDASYIIWKWFWDWAYDDGLVTEFTSPDDTNAQMESPPFQEYNDKLSYGDRTHDHEPE